MFPSNTLNSIKKMEFVCIILISTSEYIVETFNNLKNEHLWNIQGLASSEL